MILRHTVVFPEAVPPATPIRNGPLEGDLACLLALATRLPLGERGGLDGGVNGELVSVLVLRSNSMVKVLEVQYRHKTVPIIINSIASRSRYSPKLMTTRPKQEKVDMVFVVATRARYSPKGKRSTWTIIGIASRARYSVSLHIDPFHTVLFEGDGAAWKWMSSAAVVLAS